MKTKLERFFFAIILAPLAPLAAMMLAWWGSYSLLPETWIPTGTVAGFLLGIIADTFVLKGLVERACQLRMIFWVTVYLFYTVGVFGFFMGVPVFNALLAIPAGFAMAARVAESRPEAESVSRTARRTAWFTTGIVFGVCAASAAFALLSSSTPSDLRGMLGLGFEVTQGMILVLILVGGAGLLALNWVLTWGSTRLAYKFLRPEAWTPVPAA